MQPQKTLEKMGAVEVKALAEQVEQQEEIVNDLPADEGGIGASHIMQDQHILRQRIAKGKRVLERDSQLIAVSPGQRDAIHKEIKRLEEVVVKEMPTVREMNYPLGSVESEQAVRKNMAFQNKYTPILLRLKDLKRRLDPDDPFAGNLERIRPK